MVTPINNLADDTPPDRLEDIDLYDMPNDDGTAVQLEFALSESSDVASYEIYAAAFSFNSVGVDGNGPETPIATLDRMPNLPLTIEILAYDAPVIPNLPVTVAIVAVDWSGNAHRDNLVTSTAIAIDDGVDDKGAYLPDIKGIDLQWIDDSILVSWEHSTEPNVRSYVIFISDNEFSEVADATMVGEVEPSDTFMITSRNFPTLTNDTTWWIGVSAKDSQFNREIIDSTKIEPPGTTGNGGDGESPSDDESSTNLNDYLTTDNMILVGMLIITIILLILVFRGRGGSSKQSKDWDLQEATWGIQAREGWDDRGSFGGQTAAPVAPPPSIQPAQQTDIYSAAQRIQQPAQPVQQQPQPQRWPQPAQQQQPAQDGIDTSFLDDLL
jgi:type II secretory pathway pseudopilin PulG